VLRVVAKEHSTGSTEELQIENALSAMRKDNRGEAESKLLRLYENSDGMTSLQPPQTSIPTDSSTEVESEPSVELKSTSDEVDASDLPEGLAELTEQVREALPKATAEDQSDLKELLERLKSAASKEDMDEVAEIRDELEDILFYVNS
jgi:hypothetical protein